MKRLIHIIIMTAGLLPYWAFAQTTVRGTVKDANGPLPGVSVQEVGAPGNGTVTDAQGAYHITLKGKTNTLAFSFISFVTQQINVTGKTVQEVVLKEDNKGLQEVMVVAYGTTKKITNTGAISTITANDIKTEPTPNIQNTLAGRVPGFISQQRSGQPGSSGADFYIRGVSSMSGASQKPLIIVDDVEYTYDQVAQLDANEIESFTILKDASSTAVFGIKGANGVLVITTRRGKIGKPQVTFTTEHGLQAAVNTPKFLNAYQVAQLRNEADANDGLPPDFTAEDIEHWRTGDDPYGHPNVDWYNTVFKKYAYQTRNNVNVSGGNEKVKYFVSVGQVGQNGLMNDFSKNTGNPENNYSYDRYDFRSNLDLRATKDMSLRLDITGRLGTTSQPHIATAPLSTIYSFQRLPPYAEPLLNPDGSYPWAFRSRNIYYETSLVGRLAEQGYDRTYRNEFNILFNVDHKLDFITKGLSVKARIAYASDASYGRSLSRDNIPAFYYNPANGTYTPQPTNLLYALPPLTLTGDASLSASSKTTNTLGSLNYDRTFNDNHVYALALYDYNSYAPAAYVNSTIGIQEVAPITTFGTTFRAGYDFKQRYLIEFDGAYNGSNRFVADHQLGFFPAVSVGWNIAEEPFFKKHVPFVDLLKLRGSYGIVGSDITAGNTYKTEQIYSAGTAYNFGETTNTAATIQEGDLGNTEITWEKSRKTDIGIDAQFFNNKLSLTIDYFYDRRYDQLITRNDVLKILGVKPAVTNQGVSENKGFDGQVSYHDQVGKFNYSAAFTFSVARNKVLYDGTPLPQYPWLSTVGRPIGQATGYNVLGFYKDANDVAASAHLTGAQPGDLKYDDLNGDGVIDQQDMRGIGKSNLPQTVLGTNLGLGYKGFSFNILFQGSFNYSYRVAEAGIIPFQGNLQEVNWGRWTPATAATATYPRLTTNLAGPSSPSAANNSSFWQIDAHYIRLKSVDLGYSFPAKWTSKLKIRSARLYVSGYDLYTWANFNLYAQDPEISNNASAGTYPVQKVYNVGLQVGF
ncbi:SusC/RagA family TonB-linked outer membrane protein [Mucilaginibacter sp. AW1-3]